MLKLFARILLLQADKNLYVLRLELSTILIGSFAAVKVAFDSSRVVCSSFSPTMKSFGIFIEPTLSIGRKSLTSIPNLGFICQVSKGVKIDDQFPKRDVIRFETACSIVG